MQKSETVWLRVDVVDRSPVQELNRVAEHLFEHGILCEINELRYCLVVQASRRWAAVLPLQFTVSVREYLSLHELLEEYDADKRYRLVKHIK